MIEHYFTPKPKSKLELRLIKAWIHGRRFEFLTAPGVFSKRKIDRGTKLLVDKMVLPDEGLILDVGCGYGPIGIVAAALNPKLHVILTDINERAVWLAKRNIKRNMIENAEVRKGFLYDAVEGLTFDAILSNPPVSAGMRVVRPLIFGAVKHLKIGGTLQIVIKSKMKRVFNSMMEDAFGNVETTARGGGYRILLSKKVSTCS